MPVIDGYVHSCKHYLFISIILIIKNKAFCRQIKTNIKPFHHRLKQNNRSHFLLEQNAYALVKN